jgi:hypothetical protein
MVNIYLTDAIELVGSFAGLGLIDLTQQKHEKQKYIVLLGKEWCNLS